MKKLKHPLTIICKHIIKNESTIRKEIYTNEGSNSYNSSLLFIVDITKQEVIKIINTQLHYNYIMEGIDYDFKRQCHYENELGKTLLIDRILIEHGYKLYLGEPVKKYDNMFYTKLVGFIVIPNMQIENDEDPVICTFYPEMYQINSILIEEHIKFNEFNEMRSAYYF